MRPRRPECDGLRLPPLARLRHASTRTPSASRRRARRCGPAPGAPRSSGRERRRTCRCPYSTAPGKGASPTLQQGHRPAIMVSASCARPSWTATSPSSLRAHATQARSPCPSASRQRLLRGRRGIRETARGEVRFAEPAYPQRMPHRQSHLHRLRDSVLHQREPFVDVPDIASRVP